MSNIYWNNSHQASYRLRSNGKKEYGFTTPYGSWASYGLDYTPNSMTLQNIAAKNWKGYTPLYPSIPEPNSRSAVATSLYPAVPEPNSRSAVATSLYPAIPEPNSRTPVINSLLPPKRLFYPRHANKRIVHSFNSPFSANSVITNSVARQTLKRQNANNATRTNYPPKTIRKNRKSRRTNRRQRR